MNSLGVKTHRLLVIGFLLSAPLLFGACAQKAKMIRVGAAQFEAESLVAIEKIDELRRKEVEATPPTRDEAYNVFLRWVKTSNESITAGKLDLIINPDEKKVLKS